MPDVHPHGHACWRTFALRSGEGGEARKGEEASNVRLHPRVVAKLEEIYKTGARSESPSVPFGISHSLCPAGKLRESDLDRRALETLRGFAVEEALAALSRFAASNLVYVANKSALLCGLLRAGARGPRDTTDDPVFGKDDR